MKVVITAKGPNLGCALDPRFGRAANLLLVDTDSGRCESHDNSANAESMSGAGVQASQSVVDLGATVLITGHVGPKALRVLQVAGIEIYTGVDGTAQDALRMFEAGELRAGV